MDFLRQVLPQDVDLSLLTFILQGSYDIFNLKNIRFLFELSLKTLDLCEISFRLKELIHIASIGFPVKSICN